MNSTQICSLCSEEVNAFSISQESYLFCCAGCHAVFNILLAKQQLDQFQDHPIFLEAVRSGLISNPSLLQTIQKQRSEILDGEREKLYLEIGDMWCPSCSEVIKLIILKEKGVINCVVDYATDLAAIEFSPRYLGKDELIGFIKKLGYTPRLLGDFERSKVQLDLYIRFGIAIFCALNAMMFAYPLYATYFSYDGENYGLLFAWLSFVVSLPVVFYSGIPIWRRCLNSLKSGFFGMEILVFISVTAAFFFSIFKMMKGDTEVYYDSMCVIIAFVLLGKIVETKAKFSAKESLFRLSKSTPRRGRKRFSDGTLRFVLTKEIEKGDYLVAYAGEKIALDGVIVEGEGACDESLMTGEVIPTIKKGCAIVLGGTILVQGRIVYQVTSTPEQTALHKIIEMIERDVGYKSVYVRAADRIVRWFVPMIVIIAILTGWIYWIFPMSEDPTPAFTAWLRAIAVLLIACPCAIGIAAPTAEAHILKGLAGLGMIVRNRGCLSDLGNESVIVFDKTGTVTEGRYVVQGGLEQLDKEEKQALYSLALFSMHPVCCALVSSLQDCEKEECQEFEEVIGYGIKGKVKGRYYFLGSLRFLNQMGISPILKSAFECNEEGFSKVYFADSYQLLTALKLGDKVRIEMKEVINELKKETKRNFFKKIQKGCRLILLSGDSEYAVSQVAKRCGFDSWKSGCTPLEKRNYIESLRHKGEIVCMIGDGINDAPSLTAATIGVSVVSATDMSIQVSDLLLTTENLSVLDKARRFAQKGQEIVSQNLFWAFSFNVVGIFLAVTGHLSPIFAAFAMSMSSVIVLLNSRRLSNCL